MSEQNPLDSSEYQAESSERQEAPASPNFIDYADVILDQVDEAGQSETFDGIQAIVSSIEASANEGLITDSKGEVQTAEYIHNALDMYVDWANKSADERTPKSPLLLLTRKGGLRGAFSELDYDSRTKNTLLAVLTQNRANRLKTPDVPVPAGDSLQDIMGASEARQLIGVESEPTTSEIEPEEREVIEDELAEEAFEQVGISEPESFKFDLEAAKARVEKEDAERAIPREDLNDLQANVNDLLHQFDVATQHGAEATGFRNNLTSAVLVEHLASKSKQELQGIRTFSKQTLAYELGAYLTMAGNPNVVDALMNEARTGKLLDEQDLAAIEAAVVSVSRNATAQGDGPQFHEVLRTLQSNAENRRDEQQLSPVDFAVRGAIIGAYTHLGESDAIHYASRIHNGNMTDFDKIKK